MSIEQANVIDFLSISNSENCCYVIIADHLEWESRDHLIALQDKINNYLSFIESGEIYEAKPEAKGKSIEVSIHCKFTPVVEDDVSFLRFAGNAIRNAGFRFSVIIDNEEFQMPDSK